MKFEATFDSDKGTWWANFYATCVFQDYLVKIYLSDSQPKPQNFHCPTRISCDCHLCKIARILNAQQTPYESIRHNNLNQSLLSEGA